MNRRALIAQLAALPLLPSVVGAMPRVGKPPRPSPMQWERLRQAVGGRLLRLQSAFAQCSSTDACNELFKNLKNPYYINEHPNVTQTLGWAGAWQTTASPYAAVAGSAADVSEALKFAREHDLRVVVRGGAHSYQGTSNAPNSLLIWTHPMNAIVMHDAFVPHRCASEPAPAVSVGAGNIWMRVYDAVTTQHGRYVQGGGCATVGVAGLVSSGGFGSFSKNFGTAAAGLLEAEVVTGDGAIRIANACSNSDLFWALKGGGGGTFGVITRLTLQTHELPSFVGPMNGTLKANSDGAFRRLIARFVETYADQLHNPHWGEQAAFTPDNALELSMLFQGLDRTQARAAWKPFLDWVISAGQDYQWTAGPLIAAFPARHLWDAAFIETIAPKAIVRDPRPAANSRDVWWAGDADQVGQYLYAYESLWMPAELLDVTNRARFVDALFAASRHWRTSLHFNKGLSGAPDDAIARSRDTATNPAVLDAFALAIVASGTDNVYPGVAGHEVNMIEASANAAHVRTAMQELRAIVPDGGSYVSEASYFDSDWQRRYWGDHYPRLAAIKAKYDAAGLFRVHHGVGSEVA